MSKKRNRGKTQVNLPVRSVSMYKVVGFYELKVSLEDKWGAEWAAFPGVLHEWRWYIE